MSSKVGAGCPNEENPRIINAIRSLFFNIVIGYELRVKLRPFCKLSNEFSEILMASKTLIERELDGAFGSVLV